MTHLLGLMCCLSLCKLQQQLFRPQTKQGLQWGKCIISLCPATIPMWAHAEPNDVKNITSSLALRNSSSSIMPGIGKGLFIGEQELQKCN